MSRARRALIAVTSAWLFTAACGADSYWVRADEPAPTHAHAAALTPDTTTGHDAHDAKTLNTRSNR